MLTEKACIFASRAFPPTTFPLVEYYQAFDGTGYTVSNHGNVRDPKGRLNKQRFIDDAFLATTVLYPDGKRRFLRVCRMVLAVFGNVPLAQRVGVVYRDDNPRNVRRDNLETVPLATTIASKKVYEFSVAGDLIKVHESVGACAQDKGYAKMEVSDVCRKGEGLLLGRIYQYDPVFDALALSRRMRHQRQRTNSTIYQYGADGKLLRAYDTLADVLCALKITDAAPVERALLAGTEPAYGFLWSTERHRDLLRHRRVRYDFVLRDLAGAELARARTLAEAEKTFGMNRRAIYEFLAGTKLTYHRAVRVSKEERTRL